jgi:hypothetical protein
MANVLRLSQLINIFGPGAMVDLPTRSIIVGGLDRWSTTDPQVSRIINEPRLQRLLENAMRKENRLADDASILLRTPPVDVDTPGYADPHSIDAMVFPTYFICDYDESAGVANVRRRRLVRWQHLDEKSARSKYRHPAVDKPVPVSPIRFVGACKDGHLDDIDWRWAVHAGADERCSLPLFLEEHGTSGAPTDTAIACDCGRRITLEQAYIPGRLGPCRGHRPWLGHDKREACDQSIRLLTRTATNTYFPQVVTVISLPQGSDVLAKAVDSTWENLQKVDSLEKLQILAENVPAIARALKGHDLELCFTHIRSRKASEVAASDVSPRVAEFDLLATGASLIGVAGRGSHLYGQTLQRQDWLKPSHLQSRHLDLSFIRNVVAVHRLREVSCLYGFTRFEPAPTLEDDVEEVRLAVSGIFLHIEPAVIEAWLAKPEVLARGRTLKEGHTKWQAGYPGRQNFPGLSYVLLHSLAHALMIEVALESGYPASSVKERVYAIRSSEGEAEPSRLGILIYTASSGAQGTLGGLVGSANRIALILESALTRIGVCSNDPVCADHDPGAQNDDRLLHGAACHGCLLVAETSCEKRNEFLDRALLIETMSSNRSALFDEASSVGDTRPLS